MQAIIFLFLKIKSQWRIDYLNLYWTFFIYRMQRSFLHFHTATHSCSPTVLNSHLGSQARGRVDWAHHSQAMATRLLLVFLTHFLHACFKSGKKQTFGPEKQRSSNFLALVLGPWWSREHNVVIGARLTLGHGHCSRPKPN